MKSNVNIGCIGCNSDNSTKINGVVKSLLAANEIPSFTLHIKNPYEHQKSLLVEVEKGFKMKWKEEIQIQMVLFIVSI